MHPIRAPLLLLTLLLGLRRPRPSAAGGRAERAGGGVAAAGRGAGGHERPALPESDRRPLSLRRRLSAPVPTAEGLLPSRSTLTDGPLLRYDYQLPAGMASLPLAEPCLRYEFELRHLGRLGQLTLHWQGAAGSGSNGSSSATAPFRPKGPVCNRPAAGRPAPMVS